MQGQVYKIHSDFFYVNTPTGIFECKLREVLKKQKQSILVGDFVVLDQVNNNSMQACIYSVAKRQNYISHPKAANVSQAIIVSALKEPELSFEQLDRYLALCEYHKIKPILCFNKEDLLSDGRLEDKIESIYKKLGYELIFTSALKKKGIDKLKQILRNNCSILCGSSGVGKSSLINAITGTTRIRTKEVSTKTSKGTHTTRHCEIIKIEDDSAIIDTPGFSHLKFDFLLPYDVQNLFPELRDVEKTCKYNNCLHIHEDGCTIKESLDCMSEFRYESYTKLVNEAKEFKTKITYSGNKVESKTKINKNKVMTKISTKKRDTARKTANQNFLKTVNEEPNE